MAKSDSFKKATVNASAAGRAAGFKNATKKYDMAAAFLECGLDVTKVGVVKEM